MSPAVRNGPWSTRALLRAADHAVDDDLDTLIRGILTRGDIKALVAASERVGYDMPPPIGALDGCRQPHRSHSGFEGEPT